MIIPLGWPRPRALAGGLLALGMVMLLSARELPDWRALTFLGLALAVPSAVWLVADRWFARPRGVLWWVLVAVAVAMGVWGIALFPER
ncbi:hypothetical protein [Corynebacterium hadale]|uniref:hypothetical protein n=1 Tax=Corynebacterium hadale TaxID=2026255 RepID=UPI00105550D9|nr:hypothetical protein [Corynebacterium hadale]